MNELLNWNTLWLDYPVLIRFERTGGFAGLSQRATLDSESLTPEQLEELERLLEHSRFFELPVKLEARAPGADRFQYLLTVEDKGRVHTVRAGDAAVPNSLRPLLDWLGAAARARR